MSFGVNGLGVKSVSVNGLVASWATQPWNVSESIIGSIANAGSP